MHESGQARTCLAMEWSPPGFLLQTQTPHEDQDYHAPTSVTPVLLPHDFPVDAAGVRSFLGKRRSMSFQGMEGCDLEMNGEDDLSDDCAHLGEKKRRLNVEQVKMLEKNFELGNRLEPERKLQLARALGLQPRQVAIWFQNRRARWKTKQLEKDYDLLKKQYEAMKSDNEVLLVQNKKLQAEIMAVRGREISESINLNKDTEGSCSNRSENNADLNLDMSRAAVIGGSPSRSDFRSVMRPPSVAQLLQTSSASALQCPKMEHGVQGDGYCNMFCTIDDQPGFWTSWPEQQNFH